MSRTSLTILCIAVALAPGHANVSDANANPVRKVVSLLQGMAKKIEEEGKKEEELYGKFMCYCKTSGGDLQEAISGSTAKVPQLQSDIEESQSKLKQTKLDLKSHQEDRAAAKAAMASATSQRGKENVKYTAEADEYKSYISALAGAIPAIEKGMSGAFLQAKLGLGLALQKAVAKSEQTTDYDKDVVTAFLSGRAQGQSGYVPKSGEITGILKEMNADFKKSLAEIDDEEAGQVKLFEELIAAKTKQVQALTDSIEKKSIQVGELAVSIVTMKNDLTETESALIADQKFIADLGKSCETKKGEQDERTKTRGEELVAIHDTIKILNDDDALEMFKKTLPSASLLQVETHSVKLRNQALRIVRKMQSTTSSPQPALDLLAMTLSGKGVDFSKVLKMIDDMVALLKTEQGDDENKKEYCDMQLDMVEDKAKELQGKLEDLTTSIEEKEAFLKTVVEDIKVLTKGIKALDKSVSDATYQRKSEHDEFVELSANDNAAKELLLFAKNRLAKFYNPKLYKSPPKRVLSEEERISEGFAFVQIHQHHSEAPPPPPAVPSGDYGKKTEESSGVVAMIDLLVRDLDKELTEAKSEEANSQKDYEHMMNDSAKKNEQPIRRPLPPRSLPKRMRKRARLPPRLQKRQSSKNSQQQNSTSRTCTRSAIGSSKISTSVRLCGLKRWTTSSRPKLCSLVPTSLFCRATPNHSN